MMRAKAAEFRQAYRRSNFSWRPVAWWGRMAALVAVLAALSVPALAQAPKRTLAQRIAPDILQQLYPGAEKLGEVSGKPPAMSVLKGGQVVGYIYSTLDVVNMPGYSSTPFDVLAGVDLTGTITGAKVIYHSEPHVLNDSIRQPKLDHFLASHLGYKLFGANIPQMPPDYVAGATITARAMRAGVRDSAKFVMRARGMGPVVKVPTLDIDGFSPLTFQQLLANGSLQHRWVSNEEAERLFAAIGAEAPAADQPLSAAPDDIFVHLFAAYSTPEMVGRNLFGANTFASYASRKAQGGQVLFFASTGRFDILGNAYNQRAKNYTFDRLQLAQGEKVFHFDRDHFQRIAMGSGEGVRGLSQGGLFFLDGNSGFDPMKPWRLELIVPSSDAEGAKSLTIPVEYRLPSDLILMPDQAAEPAWIAAWSDARTNLIVLGVMLTVLTVILALQGPLSRRRKLHRWVRNGYLLFCLVWLGWYAGGQLTIINIVNYLQAPFGDISLGFYLAEPLIVVIVAYTLVSLVLLGRGVFCGWLCPFGALQELLGQLARAIGLPQWQPSEKLQDKLWWGKYASALVVIGIGFYSMEMAETASEVEPFKTAITAHFIREWPYVIYSLALLSIGLFSERAYCRFLCPLGGVLAFVGKLHLFDMLKRREACGSPCHLCERACPVKAIAHNGKINMTECFQCLDCQVEYYDDKRCPPLVKDRKQKARQNLPVAPGGMPVPAVARTQVTI